MRSLAMHSTGETDLSSDARGFPSVSDSFPAVSPGVALSLEALALDLLQWTPWTI